MGLPKLCSTLGEFVPYGQEFLADGGSCRLVPSERDGIVAEEELYVSSDAQVIWSSGRHIVRGFRASSRVEHVLFCQFTGVPESMMTDANSSSSSAGQCLCIVEADRLTVYAPSGAEFLVHSPMRALRAWPLADGLLLAVCSHEGSHVLSLTGHPLNLPRCISYIDIPGSCNIGVWKDVLPLDRPGPMAGSAELRWVSAELPLAIAYAPKTRRHGVFLIRRLSCNSVALPEAAVPPSVAFEAPAICREPSEVFLQQLWAFPAEGPPCDFDDVSLLAPDPEFARSESRDGRVPASGVLLALFVQQTREVCVVRLWTWEVLSTINECLSVVALFPNDDLSSRLSCTSGLASFPSRWYGVRHCRTVLQESVGPPLPHAPQSSANLFFDPMEQTRSSAVLCYDRHRLSQYLLVLHSDKMLKLYWGHVAICCVEVSDSLRKDCKFTCTGLSNSVANRFTFHCSTGMYRCSLGLQPLSPRLGAALQALTLSLPADLAYSLAGDVQVWCVRRGGRGCPCDDAEWNRFCELLFCLTEEALAEYEGADGPPFKRPRTSLSASGGCDADSDWEWLLGSSMHARERLNPKYQGLSGSAHFVPHAPLRGLTDRGPLHAAAAEPSPLDVWEAQHVTSPMAFLASLHTLFITLHLLYEEWKLHVLHARFLSSLALFLHGLSLRLQCPHFAAHYSQDFPTVCDEGLAMTAFGGYGAWLWGRTTDSQGSGHVEALKSLREMAVPHLLTACRLLQDPAQPTSYPRIFPLSSLLLSITQVLQGSCELATSRADIAQVPGPPQGAGPLVPFVSSRQSRVDAERARAMRRWLDTSGCVWERVLMLLVQHRVTRSDVELWTLALATPVQECIRAAAEEPHGDWPVEAYALIGREDLAMLTRSADGEPGARGKDLASAGSGTDELLASSPSADPLESSEWLYRMFDRDRRAKEVARLLSSSRPLTLRVTRRLEQTDHDFEHFKQSRLGLAANRQAALCVGRGAFTLGAVRPLPTELLHTPPLTLAGRFPPQTAVVSLDPNHHGPELNVYVWAEFGNGVATALQVSDPVGVEITRGWILHHKSEASTSGQGSAHAHAGFLCGLGLRGHLTLTKVDCYKYLRAQHDTTILAVILGMAASHVGSMDAGLTRMCCMHIPSMLPATYSDMEAASSVQCAAVLSLGLLFTRSAHRMMTELLVAEIGRRPSDRALHDREGYSLAAGFALGCVCLGLGAEAPGLADLQLHTWLLRYIHGGPSPTGSARDKPRQNPNHDPATCSSVIAEGEGINISITSPAGCVALALMFLQTNCEAVASRIVIPQNVFQLDYIRPDFAMLRLMARCLIMWDDIEASEEWLEAQLPPFLGQLEAPAGRSPPGLPLLRDPPRSGPTTEAAPAPETLEPGPAEIDWLLVGQTRVSLITGACLAVGLRYAGTADPSAKRLLTAKLKMFRDARRSAVHPARMASVPTPGMDLDRSTLETCQSVVAVSLGMVMAATGDLGSLQILRSLRKRADLETSYGVHMATHMAIGFVFLGGGRYTFNQDPLSIATLLMAVFPRFPVTLTDNRCHLQAFRHLYVLAARHHCVEAVEVDTQQPVDVMVSLQSVRGRETAMLPRLMLCSRDIHSITLQSERYWPVTICRPSTSSPAAGRWMSTLEASRRLYVKRRAGHLPHRMDHLGAQGAAQAWFPTFTAPGPQHVERLLQMPEDAGKVGLSLRWLQRSSADGSGPLALGTLSMSSAEWAVALCCPPSAPLQKDVYEFDFEGEDGSLTERFAGVLRAASAREAQGLLRLPHVRFAHWLHECIIASKLIMFPAFLILHFQTRALVAASRSAVGASPASLLCSAMAVDQLLTLEGFYRAVHSNICAKPPLLSTDLIINCCDSVRGSFSDGGSLATRLGAALRARFGRHPTQSSRIMASGEVALVAIYMRLHGLQEHEVRQKLSTWRGSGLETLPRLRKQFPGVSAQALRALSAIAGGA